ncbi:MAG: Uma2 family endonuclease [Chitinophagales bacterium]|jgi:Uma2 family endonuclease|nr:Uma2 family endonuclease [Chitinophagales bacterium]
MSKILLDIPDEVKAQEFLKYFVPNLSFVATAELVNDTTQSIDNEEDTEDLEESENEVSEPPLYYTRKHSYTVADIQAIADNFPADYHWTYKDLLKYFPSDLQIRVEILENQLFIMPSPEQIHQEVTFELCAAMKSYAKKHQLGTVIISPFDVVLDENNVMVPDVVFVSISRQEILDGKKANGAPDLVVEVWSPGNKKKERDRKHRIYAEKGVQEFWAVYPKKEKITVEVLNETGKYEIYSEAKKNGEIKSKMLSGFSLDVADIFPQETKD